MFRDWTRCRGTRNGLVVPSGDAARKYAGRKRGMEKARAKGRVETGETHEGIRHASGKYITRGRARLVNIISRQRTHTHTHAVVLGSPKLLL